MAANLVPYMLAGGTVTGINLAFQEAVEDDLFTADPLVVGVDNNACRLAAVRYARLHRIPAVFTMLSLNGMRCQCFLQGPNEEDACLRCALPNLDPEKAAPCASAIISSCFLAGSFTLLLSWQALTSRPDPDASEFNWMEGDLSVIDRFQTGFIGRRRTCGFCASNVNVPA